MMKGDVLNGFDELNVATEYSIIGEKTSQVPANLCSTDVEPIYKSFPGWSSDMNLSAGFDAMDDSFKNYVAFIETYIGSNISVISMGPGRDETLTR
jgi:adenylosuccinate synthase